MNKFLKTLKFYHKNKYQRCLFSNKYINTRLKIFKKILFSKEKKFSLIEEEIFPIVMKYNIKLSHKLYNEDYSKKLMLKLLTHITSE